MNCFSNGKPQLSASDRTRDLRAKTIYGGASSEFRRKSGCRSYNGNIGIYKKSGKVRNTKSYQTLLSLSRGHALCIDGLHSPSVEGNTERGLERCRGPPGSGHPAETAGGCSGPISQQVKISMGWNYFNVMNLADPDCTPPCHCGFVVANSIVDEAAPPLFGLRPNQVDANLNRDGSGVIIDPSNILFGTNEDCRNPLDVNKYLKYASVLHSVKVVGPVGPADSCPPDLRGRLVASGLVSMVDDPLILGLGVIRRSCCQVINGQPILTIYALVLQGHFPTPADVKAGRYPPAPPFGISIGSDDTATTAFFMPSPTEVTHIHGEACRRNLSWGNATHQSYLSSFNYPDPYLSFANSQLPKLLA